MHHLVCPSSCYCVATKTFAQENRLPSPGLHNQAANQAANHELMTECAVYSQHQAACLSFNALDLA